MVLDCGSIWHLRGSTFFMVELRLGRDVGENGFDGTSGGRCRSALLVLFVVVGLDDDGLRGRNREAVVGLV